MTPSESCKAAGLKSLAELAEITGRSQRTLQHWAKEQPAFFAVVVRGAAGFKNPHRRGTEQHEAYRKTDVKRCVEIIKGEIA